METERICPNCHKPLPADVPLGLCPECLIKSGFPTEIEPGAGGIARFVPPSVADIARLFPQFEILSFIGKGGMGAVYKARQPALDRLIALKVLPPAVASDPGFAERFTREARALARLSHPNIVVVYDFGKAGDLHYLVMEFVDGTNLRELERGGKLSPEQALAIVPQICEALQFAHNEGIVHRDIKPENLLLDKKGRLKIADFGIAKILNVPAGKAGLTGAKDVMGTPHYMAPEQIERPQAVDHRADIYSLGVVFYEMLTGELPLGKFAPPSKKVMVDVRLDDVVLHSLEKEPSRRYQQASQVKTDVETIAGTPTPIPGPSATPAPAPPVIPPTGAEAVSDKILLPAFLLAFFFGIFGAHRFYVGKIGTGFLQLFTLGGFGIWATIDWILLLCKVFTDGNGRRITNWWHPSLSPPESAKPPKPPKSPGPAIPPTAGSGPMIIAPAIALMIAGFIKVIGMLLVLLIGWPYSGVGAFLVSYAGIFSPSHSGVMLGPGIVLFSGAPAVVMIFGALEMIRCRFYAWAIAAAVTGVIFCSLIGFPAGIWAFIVLLLPSVRERFVHQQPSIAKENWLKIMGGAGAAALLIFLMMSLAGVLHDHWHGSTAGSSSRAMKRHHLPPLPQLPATAEAPADQAPPAAPAAPLIPPLPAKPTNDFTLADAAQSPAAATLAPPQILQAQLNEARLELTNTEARYSIGMATSDDVDSARDKVDILRAELAGDKIEVAKIKLAEAQRELDLKTQRWKIGTLPHGDVTRAQADLLTAQLRLKAVEDAIHELSTQAATAAQAMSLSASTSGTPPLSYQWYSSPSSTETNANSPSAAAPKSLPGDKFFSVGDATRFSHSFDVAPGGKLTMNVDCGDVRITVSDGNVVTVHITRNVKNATDSEAALILKDEELVLDQRDREISITAQNPPQLQHLSLFDHPNLEAHYEIALPRQFDAHVETAGGDIHLSGIQGDEYVKTLGGTITTEDIGGELNAHTMGGDVNVSRCKGRVDTGTMGGNITIEDLESPGVQATTYGGSISVQFASAPTANSDLKTTGGNITVRLPENAAVTLEGHTFGGSEKSDFPVDIKDEFGNGTLRGSINGGGATLRMQTQGGNVEVWKN
jgi:TM2 domain-containing membrane protein YozV/predicted Ser/Thr protein kinase